MALPQGWRDVRVLTGGTESKPVGTLLEFGYQTDITVPKSVTGLSSGTKYLIKFDPNFGKTQVYIQNPVFGDSLQFSIDQNGQVLNEGRPNLNNLLKSNANGKKIVDYLVNKSKEATNKLIASTDPKGLTAKQKAALAKTKRFASTEEASSPSAGENQGGNNDENGGPNGNRPSTGGTSTTSAPPSPFRTVAKFNTGDDYGTMAYPETIGNGQDYMVISIYEYKVPDVFSGGGEITKDFNILGGNNDISGRTFTEKKGSIVLPVPQNLVESNQTNWGENSLNSLAAGLMGPAAGIVKDIAGGDPFGAGGKAMDAARKVFGGAATPAKTQIQQKLTLGVAAQALKKFNINVDAEAYRARATGTVINPNLELLFNGPKLRAFQFAYRMNPRSIEEARQVRKIIKSLKKSMAPKRALESADAFFLGAPNVFQIKFYHVNNNKKELSKSLPTLKTCALVNFTANYTADGFYSAYFDGQPVSVEINMSFAELTPIYNDHYSIDQDNVGFNAELSELEGSRNLTPTADEEIPQQEAPPPTAAEEEQVQENRRQAQVEQGIRNIRNTNIPGDPGFTQPNPGGGILPRV